MAFRAFAWAIFSSARKSYAATIDRARDILQRIAELASELEFVRCLSSSWIFADQPESAAYADLPAEHTSLMLDVGNQAFEDSYDWRRADQLLGAHWSHLGVKDVRISGRERTWCPSDEGSSDFEQVARGWQQRQRPGSWVLMPFYHADDNDAHLAALSKEVAWLRAQLAQTAQTDQLEAT